MNEDWSETINITSSYAYFYIRSINMLETIQELWDGYLGQISAAMHIVDPSSSEDNLIYAVPYCVGPKA